MKNVGTCTWTPGYLLAFDHGQNMGPSGRSPDPVALSTAVAPGRTVDVTVNLTAPAAPGHYQADLYLRSATGVNFGVGPSGYVPGKDCRPTPNAHKYSDCNQLSLIGPLEQWNFSGKHWAIIE